MPARDTASVLRMCAPGMSSRPARSVEVEKEDLRLQQRGVQPLAAPGFLALQPRHQDAVGAEQAGGQIGDGDADPDRSLAGQGGDRHQTTHPLGDLIETGALPVRAVLADRPG